MVDGSPLFDFESETVATLVGVVIRNISDFNTSALKSLAKGLTIDNYETVLGNIP